MYTDLFLPYDFKSLLLPNRIFVAPPPSLLTDSNGIPLASLKTYYRELAKRNPAVLITEPVAVSERGKSFGNQLSLSNPAVKRGLEEIAEEISKFNSIPILKLYHAGVNSIPDSEYTVYGPSAINISDKTSKIKALNFHQIDEIASAYLEGAKFAWQAGFAGVQLQVSHGSLLQQFISPITNKRQDQYGLSATGGLNFLKRIIYEIHLAIPEQFFSLDWTMRDLRPGGLTLKDSIEKLQTLTNDEQIDFIQLSSGLHLSSVEIRSEFLDKFASPAPFKPDSSVVKNSLKIPIALSGKIENPFIANRLIKNNFCDFVVIGNSLNRDPNWIRIAKTDQPVAFINSCLRCRVCRAVSYFCPDLQKYNRWSI